MPITRPCPALPRRFLVIALTALALALAPAATARAQGKIEDIQEKVLKQAEKAKDVKAETPPLPKALRKVSPETVEDLKAIQERVDWVVKKVMPAVVAVRIGAGQGSGVIVSEDGYVLTAAHVSGPAGRKVDIILPDGRRIKGETLGANKRLDAGMIKITTKGKWPHVPMGKSEGLERGDWVVAIGHPRGYIQGRSPPVRLGRVLDNLATLIRTDCTLVGGDSGGPLFNMNGEVVGIHSRIGPSIIYNIHVPVDAYTKDWEKLVAGEVFPSNTRPYIGVEGDPDARVCRITKVRPGTPAEKAGLKENDIIVRFAGKKIDTFEDLVRETLNQRPGAEVAVEVQRDGEMITLKLRVGKKTE